MGLFDWVKQKQEDKRKAKEVEDELRRQAEAEVSDQVIQIKKEKIKEQILAEARGEKKEDGKGAKLLKALGEEFKQSNLGDDKQMEKLLGKRSTTNTPVSEKDNFSTERLMNTIGGQRKTVNTNVIVSKPVDTKKDISGTLGGSGPTNDKLRLMAGIKDNTENLKKMSRLKKDG
jgi:hypothetical protein